MTTIDSRIGQLCREGQTVYYIYPAGGEYQESVSQADLVAALAKLDAPAGAKGRRFATFAALKNAMRDARDMARRQAQRDCGRGALRSRGSWFITMNDKQGLIAPRNENTFYGNPITARELDRLIDEVLQRHPEVDTIELAGGFDWARTVMAFADSEYDPWVSEWCLTVWRRQ